MFNLQGSELVIILLLALVVLGPEKLPEAMRRLGQLYAQLKKMSAGFQQEFKAAVDEPMREVRETANMLRDSMDFRTLQEGERPEKPKSGDMAAVTPPAAPAPPDAPTDDVPFQEPPPPEGHPIDVPLETRVEETPVEAAPVEETPVEETLVEEILVEEILVDEALADETPEQTPAEPATDEVTKEW